MVRGDRRPAPGAAVYIFRYEKSKQYKLIIPSPI